MSEPTGYGARLRDLCLGLFGWRFLVFTGDPCVFDRYRWIRRNLGAGGGPTMDAGAGNGAIATFLASRGEECLALSFDAREMGTAARSARICGVDGVSFAVRDLRELDGDDSLRGRFDRVICLEVAEHILDDEKLFRDLAATLRPGGRLLLTTPFSEHRALYSERLSEREDGGHVRWGYSEARLRELCAQARLEPIEVGRVSGLVSQQLTNLQRILQSADKWLGWAVVFPLRALQAVDRPLTGALRYPHLSITLTAVRR